MKFCSDVKWYGKTFYKIKMWFYHPLSIIGFSLFDNQLTYRKFHLCLFHMKGILINFHNQSTMNEFFSDTQCISCILSWEIRISHLLKYEKLLNWTFRFNLYADKIDQKKFKMNLNWILRFLVIPIYGIPRVRVHS